MAVSIPGYGEFDEIARGGFGVVYRAQDVELGRVVAVKVLSRVDLDEVALQRFDRERRAMGALSWHPHIVVVHDSGRTVEGEPYLAMEYLEGGSLADDLSARGALAWDEAVARVIEVAGALQVAHDAGLLHRDLKPANIMRGPYGEAKLTDFGIVGTEDAGHTATGMVSFTLGHAAPEVLQGERATVRSDVYSLASTLYELVAGRAPFLRAGEESMVPALMRTINEPPPDLERSEVPPALAAALGHAMAKDPADRPADAAALGRLLQRVQREAGVPVTELRLDPKATGGGAGADATVTTALTASVASPPPPPPAPPGPTAPPAPPASGPTGGDRPAVPRRRTAVLVAVGVVATLVVGAVAALLLSGGDDSPGTAASTTVTTASADSTDDESDPSATSATTDAGSTAGASENAELEAFCDAVDEYVAAADAIVGGTATDGDRAAFSELGGELPDTAVALATSGLSADEQQRYVECSDALTEAGQG
ncbi:MAG: serine/threonine protein kinase [Acidimicrobiales bacterium]|nr:serine/threonine protein kinase [Acidimicrobiales bacterium]